jgi:prevent-host-death family protein
MKPLDSQPHKDEFYMANLNQHRAQALYTDGTSQGLTGAEVDGLYTETMLAEVLPTIGVYLVLAGDYSHLILGSDAAWGTFALVRYPSLSECMGMVASPEIKASATVKAEDFKGLNKLKDACGKQFAAGVVFYDGESILPFGEKLFSFMQSPALNTYLGPAGVKNSAAENCTWWLTCIWTIFGSVIEVFMKLSSQIKPISYLKAHAAEIVRNLSRQAEPLIITQNGEAKVVIQDIASYEQTQETMALLKMLALGTRQVEEGRVHPAGDVVRRLRGSKSR